MMQSLSSRRLQTRQDLKQLNMKQVEIKTSKIHNQVLSCIETVKLNVPGQTFLSDSKSGLTCTSYFLAGSPASYIKGLPSIYKVLVKWAQFSSVQFSCSVVSDSLRPHEYQHTRRPCPSPSPGVHSNSRPLSRWCHLILCRPLFLLSSIPPSIRVFSNESTLHMRWPKYWSFAFSIIPSKEIPGLISFRMDLLDLLAVQGTLKSLL